MRSISSRRSPQLDRELANTRFERILGNASQLALVFIAGVVALLAIDTAQFILAPVFLAIIIGLMCGPIADFMERRGLPPPLSAGVVVIVLVAIVAAAIYAFANPLSVWAAQVPEIWERLRTEIANLREPLEALAAMQAQVQQVFGSNGAMTVQVADGGPINDLAVMAPAALGQVLIFFGGLYFFLTARDGIRIGILSLCFTRKVRWRTAHVFRDVELRVSRFLLTITLVNLTLGAIVAIAMWLTGMPSPLLWGAMAFLLNYVPFIGQATMVVLIFIMGIGTRDGVMAALLPTAAYWAISFAESQVITPQLLGRTMTINPFVIFLSLTFWLWVWGPVGGLIAVPSVLILQSILTHIVPMRQVMPARVRRKLEARVAADTRRSEQVRTMTTST